MGVRLTVVQVLVQCCHAFPNGHLHLLHVGLIFCSRLSVFLLLGLLLLSDQLQRQLGVWRVVKNLVSRSNIVRVRAATGMGGGGVAGCRKGKGQGGGVLIYCLP